MQGNKSSKQIYSLQQLQTVNGPDETPYMFTFT